ncbi:MAG TPA: MotA/TolQ/ExbB proton channel family protein [Pirellulaceae bacterium]|nr:MotA/TolQ/ExbB proton channel family protein [Pirellulaceae bacterium]
MIRFAAFAVLIWLAVGSLPFEASGQGRDSIGTAAGAAPGDGQSGKKPSLTFWQIIFSGGPLGIANMVVLIGLSITALALAADDLRIVRKARLIPDGLSDDVRELMAAGELGQARSACLAQPSFLSAVILHGLSEAEGGWAEVEKAMEDATAEQAARLFRRIEYLSVIGNIAPMVGLLGTVTGMLLAFKQVADTEGNAGAAQLADGIYQALVTTVAGLIIAIPSLGAFALFRSRVDQLVAEAAYAALHAMSPLKQRGGSQSPPGPPPPAPPRTEK